MNSRYVPTMTMMTATKNQVSAASGSRMDTASQYAPPSRAMPSTASAHLARGGFSPTDSLRSRATALTRCSSHRERRKIRAWMAANRPSVTSSEGMLTVKV